MKSYGKITTIPVDYSLPEVVRYRIDPLTGDVAYHDGFPVIDDLRSRGPIWAGTHVTTRSHTQGGMTTVRLYGVQGAESQPVINTKRIERPALTDGFMRI